MHLVELFFIYMTENERSFNLFAFKQFTGTTFFWALFMLGPSNFRCALWVHLQLGQLPLVPAAADVRQCKPLFWMKCRLLDKNILLSGFGHIHRCCGFMENHLDPLTGEFLFHSSSDCWARAWPCLSSSGCWLIAHKHSCSSIVLINRKSYLSTCTYNP